MTKRALFQARPRNGDKRLYSPNRDLAYIYLPAIKEAIAGLDKISWTPELQQLLQAHDVSEDDIGEAVKRLAAAHLLFVNRDDIKEPLEALTLAHFFECKPVARTVVFSRFGEVILGGFFVALRDVTPHGQEPPQGRDIAEFVAAGRLVAERSSGIAAPPTELAIAQANLAATRIELAELRTLYNRLQTTLTTATAENNAALSMVARLQREIERRNSLGFWPSVWLALRQLKQRWIPSKP